MGLLRHSSPGSRRRRAALLASVVALHAGALLVLVNSRIQPERVLETQPIQMLLLAEEAPRASPPTPSVEVFVPPIQVVVPQLDLPELEVPPPRAVIPQATAPESPPTPVIDTPSPARTLVESNAPVLLASEDVAYLREPEPRYPRAARQARLQGTVLVWVLIDVDGRAREVRVHRSSGYEQLDREASDAVSRAMFKPYREQGVVRMAQAIVPIEFTLAVRTARR
jgi:protein TonB